VVGHPSEVEVVVAVEGQQKPTMSGVSVTSFGRHAGRILTPPLIVPSLRCRAQKTLDSAVSAATRRTTETSNARAIVGIEAPPARGDYSLARSGVNERSACRDRGSVHFEARQRFLVLRR
jgi:hypothetical protein